MTHNHILILGWQNPAALSYPTQPHQQPYQQAHPYQNVVTPGFPSVPSPFGMPPLPNAARDNSRVDGVSLSYGFAPNVVPCHIPNAQRQDSVTKGPAIGWAIGDRTDGACMSSQPAQDTPAENKQIETLCRAITVPDEDMPIYSFGYSSVRYLEDAFK